MEIDNPYLKDGNPCDDRPHPYDSLMGVAEVVRKRSSCLRGKVGVVIVRHRRIISTGYNGAPPGMPHCFELGCDVDENNHDAGCQRSIHAEANAIAWAARDGISTSGAQLFTTHSPCLKCAQLILACGISEVFWRREYRLPQGMELLTERGIHLCHVPEP